MLRTGHGVNPSSPKEHAQDGSDEPPDSAGEGGREATKRGVERAIAAPMRLRAPFAG